MDDETRHHRHHRRRRRRPAALKIGLVVLGVLVLLGVVQGLTSGIVGVGALSVTFRSTPTTSAGVDGVVGTTGSAEDAPTTGVEAKVVVGAWKQARGLLTVEVSRVENRGGRVRLYVTAVNAGTSKMDLPLVSVVASDDVPRNYSASTSTSKWPVSVARNASISGYVELDPEVPASATMLTLTFGGIIGQLAPTGGELSVGGIPIPR